MSGAVVNLRRARKRRARDEARAEGDAAAARHGESKAARRLRDVEADKLRRTVDGARRGDDAD